MPMIQLFCITEKIFQNNFVIFFWRLTITTIYYDKTKMLIFGTQEYQHLDFTFNLASNKTDTWTYFKGKIHTFLNTFIIELTVW